jgi:non-reducing end alpha-L-arabinofuranosidase
MTRNVLLGLSIFALAGAGLENCTIYSNTDDSAVSESSGGATGNGGAAGNGGQSGSGGSSTVGSGGVTDPGGAKGSGGISAEGGATGKGGQLGSGGIDTSSGGRSGSGGATAQGGVSGSGGAAQGGAPGSGGATNKGGAPGSGGATTTAASGGSGAGGTTGTGGSTTETNPKGPCDIYLEKDGKPCVAAHSTTRLLLSTYTGPLYQVRKGGSASGTGGATQDIGIVAGGFADSGAQDTFCGSTACTISKIYDQSGQGNHLTVAPAGGAKKTADLEADAKAKPITISGHKVYGEDGKAGVGYRNNKCKGTATGDNAETEYAIFDATVYNNQCCFDYGNMETNSLDNGEGTMDAIYWGNCTGWGRGGGSGPWVMGDLENGLWAGNTSPYNNNTSITGMKYVTAMLKSDAAGKNHWTIKAGNSQSGALEQKFDGQRPSSRYNPMRKEGAIGLNTGGDNSNSAIGVFFEGAMTAHYSSDAADSAVQENIVSVYGK